MKIISGDQVAQETFYNKYKKIVKDFIRSKYPKLNDTDDYVADILIKVFYSLDKYDQEKSSVKSWVLVITKHYMIDVWRTKAANGTFCNSSLSISNNGMATGQLTVNGTPIGWADEATITTSMSSFGTGSFTTSNADCEFENCNTVCYLSTQLSPMDFSLLNMKYVQGYDYNEIGKEFNLTSSTVSNRINYVKTKLKKNNTTINE